MPRSRSEFRRAYWSLADLKNYVFSDTEIAAMHALVKGDGGDDTDQAQLHFALGRAFEHKKNYAAARSSLTFPSMLAYVSR